jgi:hypothetical protein
MKKIFLTLFTFVLLTGNLKATDWSEFQKILDTGIVQFKFKGTEGEFSHNAFDYEKIRNSPDALETLTLQKNILSKATIPHERVQLLTFWINAYNFFTIVEVINNKPVKSMKDIGWKNRHHKVAQKEYSLDDIEHKILRPLKEPRIHFVINCASVSCPELRKLVYSPEMLIQDLNQQTKNALKNPLHLRPDGDDVAATKLFDWFEDDFETPLYEDPDGFLKFFAPKGLQKEIDSWIDYDWSLNNPKNIRDKMLILKVQENAHE